ncbi:metal-dependent hydrolase [Halosegnis marinus]|uniref:Metal-dependent hydrolase n=1 Tax=Halosegnis marinus TaxID=3034023 RepID=A0ABD5ZK60_9EURY|nr:metal-dependent hydrolase [Halosegnis sp. DT85]
MPSALVAAGLAALLAAALLDERDLTPRSLAVVVAAGIAPDLDAVIDVVFEGLHNAALHNVWIPLLVGLAVRWDARRPDSWLRSRYGDRGVRVAWVALAACCFAVALDLFNVESAAVLWPVHGRFFGVVGKVGYSTTEGALFTLVKPNLGGGELFPEAGSGTVAGGRHIATFLNPADGPDTGVVRDLVLVGSGWQLLVVLAGAVVAGGRLFRRGER